MKTALPLLAVVAAALGAAAPASAQGPQPIIPGYWESTNRLLSPIHQTKTERRCITPADVDKFLAGPSNHHYDCSYPTRIIEDGQIRLAGTCVEKKKGREVQVSGRGTYTPTRFHLEAHIVTDILGIPLHGRASTDARRIADACPTDAAGLTMK
jgi:hypothetical protein